MSISDLTCNLHSLPPSLFQLDQYVFSLCFHREGGSFTLGGLDEARLISQYGANYGSKIVWTNSNNQGSFYKVTVHAVSVVGQGSVSSTKVSAMNNGMGTIVDSGTTFTYWPTAVQQDLVTKLKAACGQTNCGSQVSKSGEDLCYAYGEPPNWATWPKMIVSFDGGDVTFDGQSLFYEYQLGSYIYCLGIYSDSGSIIGMSIMKEQMVIFDLTNSKVGWIKATCDFAAAPLPSTSNTSTTSGTTPSTPTTTKSTTAAAVTTVTSSSSLPPVTSSSSGPSSTKGTVTTSKTNPAPTSTLPDLTTGSADYQIQSGQVDLDKVSSTMIGLISFSLVVVILCITFKCCLNWQRNKRLRGYGEMGTDGVAVEGMTPDHERGTAIEMN